MSCDVIRAKHTFTMTMTTDCSSLPFIMKKERNVCNDSDSDINSDNIGDFSSVPLPSLSKNNSVIVDESNNDFLRLTTMARFFAYTYKFTWLKSLKRSLKKVRTVYSSYLHKCLLDNYATCYKQNDDDDDDDDNNVQSVEVKKCADQMELYAVHCALEASLYRQNMLRLIADVKSHTVKKKAYKKLVIFLQAPMDRIDIAIQTDEWMDLEETNIQNVSLTKSNNCEKPVQVAVPTANSSSSCENRNTMEDFLDETDMQMLQSVTKEESNDASQGSKDQGDSHTMDNAPVRNEDETSQDSLLQHMQDMFCESDDSSDLTRLIEKHSGVTKANIDKEINKICLEADIIASSNLFGVPVGTTASKPNNVAKVTTSEGKISFSRYKEMQSRRSIKLKGRNVNETVESKQKQKASAIWFVERVHQVSKLKAKMTELSLTNYRRHGRVKEKFLRLFGESEDEEMMPDSPICIEEHLPACKERIAPWIVKYLMPFYKKRRIKDRQLFKAVAKYITDMLIIENTFPEQECVRKYIEHYFKNKRSIKTKQDIYL